MIEEQKLQKCLIGFDMGNTSIRVYHGNKEIIFYNSMMIENTSIYINKKPSVSCLNDSTLLLGIKHQDPKFMQIAKYYNCTFKKGNNRSLIVKFHHKTIPDEFYIEYTIFLMIKGIFKTHPNLKYLMMTQNNLKMVVTIFQGELNSYRLSLKEIFKRCGINEISFTSTNNCIVTAYLKNIKKRQNRDYSEVVGVIDFSDKGMTFMIYKIYSTPIGLIEVLSNSFTYIGGNMLTNLIVDYVVKQLIVKKGMDISKVPKFMHKLKLLCNQAKHVLSTNEMAYVRLDNLPDILVFGCQITESQFQKCIQKDIKTNVDMIKQSIQKCNQKINKIILHGGSCKIPYFKKLIKKQLGSMKFIDSDKQWLGQGLLQIKSGRYHVIDVTNLNLRMQGDQKFACKIMQSNEQLPLRKHIPMRFPSGELTFSMRFYQNNVLVCTCFIPERPRQNKYNLYIQVDKNKMLTIYATTSHGLIKMNSNMMQIGSPQFLKHEEQTKEYDFHNQND